MIWQLRGGLWTNEISLDLNLRLRQVQHIRHFPDDIFQCIFFYMFELRLKSHLNWLSMVQLRPVDGDWSWLMTSYLDFGNWSWILTDWVTDWLTDWLAGWLTDCLIDWLMDGWMGRLIHWLIDWSIDRSIHWLIDCMMAIMGGDYEVWLNIFLLIMTIIMADDWLVTIDYEWWKIMILIVLYGDLSWLIMSDNEWWLPCWLTGWLTDWLVGWLINDSVSHHTNRQQR